MVQTIITDGHEYEVTDDAQNGYGGKKVICDLPPPMGFAQAAEAGSVLLGKSKELKRITYKGIVKLGLSGNIVPGETVAPATHERRRGLTLEGN